MREFLGIESDAKENFPHVNKGADVLNFVADMYSTSPYRDGYIKDGTQQKSKTQMSFTFIFYYII